MWIRWSQKSRVNPMQERNKYIVALVVSVVSCALWLLSLKELANYTIAHPTLLNLFWVFALAVGGGIIVSWAPGCIWNILSDEDEITGDIDE